MYVAISTDKQTGSVLGEIQTICATEGKAWQEVRRLNSKRGDGVIREVITGKVTVGEKVGFFDPRLREVWRNKTPQKSRVEHS